jgi:hypothetical protein
MSHGWLVLQADQGTTHDKVAPARIAPYVTTMALSMNSELFRASMACIDFTKKAFADVLHHKLVLHTDPYGFFWDHSIRFPM